MAEDFTIQIFDDSGKPIRPEPASPASRPTSTGNSINPPIPENPFSGGNDPVIRLGFNDDPVTGNGSSPIVEPYTPTTTPPFNKEKQDAYLGFNDVVAELRKDGKGNRGSEDDGSDLHSLMGMFGLQKYSKFASFLDAAPSVPQGVSDAYLGSGGEMVGLSSSLTSLTSSLSSVAGPLAIAAIALPIIADSTRQRKEAFEANRYDAKSTAGELIQTDMNSHIDKAKSLAPMAGYNSNMIIGDMFLEPFIEMAQTANDALAMLADGATLAYVALTDLAMDVKPYETTIATSKALTRVDNKFLEIERAQYLGPEAGENVMLQQEMNRTLSELTNQVAKPALQILNQVLDVANLVIVPVLQVGATVIEAQLSLWNGVFSWMKYAFEHSAQGRILKFLQDWRRKADRDKRNEMLQEQVDFFEKGIVAGFPAPQVNNRAQPANRGVK